MVLLLRRNLVKEKKGVWRRRIYRKYASCKWLKNAGLEFTRADVVVSISRGPPGQWFPETEHWASAIFVGTSGIPPKIIYRSVKSYSSKFYFQYLIYLEKYKQEKHIVQWKNYQTPINLISLIKKNRKPCQCYFMIAQLVFKSANRKKCMSTTQKCYVSLWSNKRQHIIYIKIYIYFLDGRLCEVGTIRRGY